MASEIDLGSVIESSAKLSLYEEVYEEVTADFDPDIDPEVDDAPVVNFQQCSNNASSIEIPVIHERTTAVKDDFNQIDEKRKESVDHVEQYDKEPSADRYAYAGSSCTESPGIASQDTNSQNDYDDDDESTDFIESAADERVACIEAEFIQRIGILEKRHNELEDVLARLMTVIECGISKQMSEAAAPPARDVEEDVEEDDAVKKDETDARPEETEAVEDEIKDADAEDSTKTASRNLSIELFIEFQHKIRYFAEDLNGVLSCSEAAIRHARIVQEWATSVQMLFEQMREERARTQNYIDEREKSMMLAREQYMSELERQGRQLQQLVDDMMSYSELKDVASDYIQSKIGERGTVNQIVDQLLKKRIEENRSIILSLSKQSKISELRLFVIHQQTCIQQLQEQNRELRAIIEGLMEPDDLQEDASDTDKSGTPASVISTPERCPVRDVLNRRDGEQICQLTDVLNCDRGAFLPGASTYGDLATVQAYKIGRSDDELFFEAEESDAVFDPLAVHYVREQCRLAEETERRAHAAENVGCEAVRRVQLSPELEYIEVTGSASDNVDGDVKEEEQDDLNVDDDVNREKQDDVNVDDDDVKQEEQDDVNVDDEVNQEEKDDVFDYEYCHVDPSQRTPAEQRFLDEISGKNVAAGDGLDVINETEASLEKPDVIPAMDVPHSEGEEFSI